MAKSDFHTTEFKFHQHLSHPFGGEITKYFDCQSVHPYSVKKIRQGLILCYTYVGMNPAILSFHVAVINISMSSTLKDFVSYTIETGSGKMFH